MEGQDHQRKALSESNVLDLHHIKQKPRICVAILYNHCGGVFRPTCTYTNESHLMTILTYISIIQELFLFLSFLFLYLQVVQTSLYVYQPIPRDNYDYSM